MKINNKKIDNKMENKKENKMENKKDIYNTYLGKLGYTLFKNELTEEEIENIKKRLIIKPFTNTIISGNPPITYCIYKESSSKIYVPKYFGIEHFGICKENKIKDGCDIDLHFNGELRDIQIKVVENYMENIKEQMSKDFKTGGGLIELQTGQGKTVIGLNIICELRKKTLIIVHKEFLSNQWIERIEQFIPNAKIGKIQGSTIDIEGKDIVIGMLQSLSKKEYPENTFDSFGLLIVDEVHHISSEVFSQALFRIVTKYTLGLSATMNRKDGTSYVFKYFLGDIIYKNENKEEHKVEVRKIKYISTDETFNETKTDYRGNPQYSTMIVKLCSFNPRTEFILKIITDMFIENPKQQIMLLAHNRSLIDYLFEAINHRNICSVGKYIGGMKQESLKESENKQIILGTYSMASEGLDIKTLTTLILATPKSDVVQSVGRILRVKDNNPIVVDIVDTHNIFQNQYSKREHFYKHNNYKIIACNNFDYNPFDFSKWNILYIPSLSKKNKEDKKNNDNIKDLFEENQNDGNKIKILKDHEITNFLQKKCYIKLKYLK